jgi:ParB family transcriptional regulator, chromosome partitioning protein
MANSKRRLGRGLESLISGGGTAAPDAPAKPTPPAAKKSSRPARPATPPKAASSSAKRNATKVVKTVEKPPVAAPPPVAPAPEAEPMATETTGLREIPIQKVEPNPHQPRKYFEESSLHELAESIRSEGLLQPIVVRVVGDHFQLIAGERRWRACQALKMKRIPARIINATESSSAVMSLIENLQRENLDPIEEAQGYACLLTDFKLTQEGVSERVGKARASIANSLRLLQLDREIQQFLSRKMLSVGHAKVLLGVEGRDEQALLARQVIERQLSVRETEKLVQTRRKGGSVTAKPSPKTLDPAESAALNDLEKRLTQSLNTRVQVKHTPKKGRILIEYFGNDDLHRILERIGVTV